MTEPSDLEKEIIEATKDYVNRKNPNVSSKDTGKMFQRSDKYRSRGGSSKKERRTRVRSSHPEKGIKDDSNQGSIETTSPNGSSTKWLYYLGMFELIVNMVLGGGYALDSMYKQFRYTQQPPIVQQDTDHSVDLETQSLLPTVAPRADQSQIYQSECEDRFFVVPIQIAGKDGSADYSIDSLTNNITLTPLSTGFRVPLNPIAGKTIDSSLELELDVVNPTELHMVLRPFSDEQYEGVVAQVELHFGTDVRIYEVEHQHIRFGRVLSTEIEGFDLLKSVRIIDKSSDVYGAGIGNLLLQALTIKYSSEDSCAPAMSVSDIQQITLGTVSPSQVQECYEELVARGSGKTADAFDYLPQGTILYTENALPQNDGLIPLCTNENMGIFKVAEGYWTTQDVITWDVRE